MNTKALFTILLGAISLTTFAQDESKTFIKSDNTIRFSLNIDSTNILLTSTDLKRLFYILSTLEKSNDTTFKTLYSEYFNGTDLSDGHAIILQRYMPSRKNDNTTNYSKISTIVISKNKGNWDPYLLARTKILLVLVDQSVYAESFKITNRTTYFSTTFTDVLKIIGDVATAKAAKPNAGTMDIRLIEFKPNKIHPPSDITYAVPIADKKTPNVLEKVDDATAFDTAKVTIHEKNRFAFSIGLNGSFLNKQNFKFNGDTIHVSLDSSQKKQLSNAITLSLDFYPFGGRDIDRYLPIWKDFKNIGQHIGLSAGISLSKDPLQSYYAGVAVCITKSFNIVGGVNFVNTTQNQQAYNLGNISSVADLNKYFLKRSYQGSFFIGISISPAQAIKDLGL